MLAWYTPEDVCDAVESQLAMSGVHMTSLPDFSYDRIHA
jgi:hypothetical protein